MQTVGAYLKSSREAKNISLSDISHHTKISKWYLDCLEKDDLKNIPGGPYIKGYISSYATFIGIDENEAIQRYDSSNLESTLANQADQNIKEKKPFAFLAFFLNKKLILIFFFILICLLLTGFYRFIFQSPKKIILDESIENPIQNEFQSSQIPAAEVSSKRLELEKSDLTIQKEATTKNLVFATNISPQLNRNNQASDEISKNPDKLDTSRHEGPIFKTDPLDQVAQIPSDPEDVVTVIEATACGSVRNRNPADAGNSFIWSSEKIYIWSMIKCQSPPSSIRHIYYFKDQKVDEILLEIKSSRWRTWSYKTLLDKRYIGPWRVDIISADGKLLETIRFEVS